MNVYSVSLTREQWNLVATGLLELPAKFVNPTLAEIDKQLMQALQAEKEASETKVDGE